MPNNKKGRPVKFNDSMLRLLRLCELENNENWAEEIANRFKKEIGAVRSWNHPKRKVPAEIFLMVQEALNLMKFPPKSSGDPRQTHSEGKDEGSTPASLKTHYNAPEWLSAYAECMRHIGKLENEIEHLKAGSVSKTSQNPSEMGEEKPE